MGDQERVGEVGGGKRDLSDLLIAYRVGEIEVLVGWVRNQVDGEQTRVSPGVDGGREAEQLTAVVVDDVELAAPNLDIDVLDLPSYLRLPRRKTCCAASGNPLELAVVVLWTPVAAEAAWRGELNPAWSASSTPVV